MADITQPQAAALTDEQIRMAMVLAPAYSDDADYAHYIRMGRAVLAAAEKVAADEVEKEGCFIVPGVDLPALPATDFKLWQSGNTTSAKGWSAISMRHYACLYGQSVRAAAASGPPKFPTALRKIWSGGEVQAWIDANWQKGGAA